MEQPRIRAVLTYEPVVSVDGFAAAPDGDISWHASEGFELMTPDQIASLASVGGILLGARTYRLLADYWPTADAEQQALTPLINSLPKHVFSNSLTAAPWGEHEPATVHAGDAVTRVRELRERVDGDLVLWGSPALAASLARAGEIDVLRLRVVPQLIGRGIGFLPSDISASLALRTARTYPGGHLLLEYALG